MEWNRPLDDGSRIRLNLLKEGDVWSGGGWQVSVKSDEVDDNSQNFLPPDIAFTDFSGRRHIDGESVYTRTVEWYIHEQLKKVPVLKREKAITRIRMDAVRHLETISDALLLERNSRSLKPKARTLIDNALDYLSYLKRAQTDFDYSGPLRIDIFMDVVKRAEKSAIQDANFDRLLTAGSGEDELLNFPEENVLKRAA